jgi:hypothetical protein
MKTSTERRKKSRPLLTAHQAVEQLAKPFERMARRLWPSTERAVQEDLVQEMNLACLCVQTPMQDKTFFSLALCRAMDYLDREARHERLQLMPHHKLVRLSDKLRHTLK